MRVVQGALAIVAMAASTTAFAADQAHAGRRASPPARPSWDFGITAYPTIVRNGENFTSAIAVADRGPLHLEARYNYESVGARSAFVGWTFSGGDTLTWEVTPLLGGVWGTTKGFVPGLEGSLGWNRLDFYIEAEYVRDSTDRSASYLYTWSELGYRPLEWLRLGIAGQRTNTYAGERDLQRGPFVQLTWRQLTIGGYWFNPGSSEQVFVGLIGVTF